MFPVNVCAGLVPGMLCSVLLAIHLLCLLCVGYVIV